jgi:hypothetical protein
LRDFWITLYLWVIHPNEHRCILQVIWVLKFRWSVQCHSKDYLQGDTASLCQQISSIVTASCPTYDLSKLGSNRPHCTTP